MPKDSTVNPTVQNDDSTVQFIHRAKLSRSFYKIQIVQESCRQVSLRVAPLNCTLCNTTLNGMQTDFIAVLIQCINRHRALAVLLPRQVELSSVR